jgi:hydrogenase maturation protease
MAQSVEMKNILVVGYGNTLRGDDGLGPAIIESLDIEEVPHSCRVRMVCLPQLDISLLTELQSTDIAIFVDARQDDDDELLLVDRLEPSHTCSIMTHSTHSMEIPALLSIADQWYNKKLTCYVIKPKGFDFSISETISEQSRQAGVLAKQLIHKIIHDHANLCNYEVPLSLLSR